MNSDSQWFADFVKAGGCSETVDIMITKMRRRVPSPSNTPGSRCDESLVAVLDEIALGQPLLTDDIKPALLEDEVPA